MWCVECNLRYALKKLSRCAPCEAAHDNRREPARGQGLKMEQPAGPSKVQIVWGSYLPKRSYIGLGNGSYRALPRRYG